MDDDFAEIARELGMDTGESWCAMDDSGVAFPPPGAQGDYYYGAAQFDEFDESLEEIGECMRNITPHCQQLMCYGSLFVTISFRIPTAAPSKSQWKCNITQLPASAY